MKCFFYILTDNNTIIKRLSLSAKLKVHTGCVNTVCWSELNPNLILSGSDDHKLVITDSFSGQVKASINTAHRTNIFSARFVPNTCDNHIVSCAAGGDIWLTDVTRPTERGVKFSCHGDKPCYEIRCPSRDSNTFLSCGQDGTCRLFDTRLKRATKCDAAASTGTTASECDENVLVKLTTSMTAIAVNEATNRQLACAGLDGLVRLYDMRCLSVDEPMAASKSTKGMFACFAQPQASATDASSSLRSNAELFDVASNKRVTSMHFDAGGNDLLISYQPNTVYLVDWKVSYMTTRFL